MILKTVYQDGNELYRELRGGFHLVKRTSRGFNGTGEAKYGDFWNDEKMPYKQEALGFIVERGGREIHPIFYKQDNYILTDSNEIFMDLTDLPIPKEAPAEG